MTSAFRRLRPAFLAAAIALAAGCASVPAGTSSRFGPGDTFEYEGTPFKMLQVDQEFVLLRHRAPEGEAGKLSGFVDEVFRVSRAQLGEGRWSDPSRMPGVSLQWLGLDSFALVKDAEVAAPASAPPAEVVVQAEPEKGAP